MRLTGGRNLLCFHSRAGFWALTLAAVALNIPAVTLAQEAQSDKAAIKVEADKKDAVYKTGEKIKFLVTALENGKPVAGRDVRWILSPDGGKESSGVVTTGDSPEAIETSIDTPGFTLMTARVKGDSGKIRAFAGAGAEPLKIEPGAPSPADFKSFWDSKISELRKLPLEVKMTAVEAPAQYKGKIEAFDVRVNCPGGAPVSGYYARPAGAARKSLPAIVSYHGAGVHSAGLKSVVKQAAKGVIAMDVNAHGVENGKPKEFYDALDKGELKDYRSRDSGDRERCYFLGMFQRVFRSLQFIKSQPEWDGKRLVATGGSQGGGQALAGAGLDPDVTLCAAYVPALCDHHGYLKKRKNGWPDFVKTQDGGATDPKVDAASAYFDCANFAPYIKARVILTVGFIDTTCCPSSVYAAYNSIMSPKEIISDPLAGHQISEIMSKTVNSRIDEHLERAKSSGK